MSNQTTHINLHFNQSASSTVDTINQAILDVVGDIHIQHFPGRYNDAMVFIFTLPTTDDQELFNILYHLCLFLTESGDVLGKDFFIYRDHAALNDEMNFLLRNKIIYNQEGKTIRIYGASTQVIALLYQHCRGLMMNATINVKFQYQNDTDHDMVIGTITTITHPSIDSIVRTLAYHEEYFNAKPPRNL